MAETEVFQAVIRAVDEATGTIHKVAEEIHGLGEQAGHTAAEIAHVDQPNVWAGLAAHLATIAAPVRDFAKGLGSAGEHAEGAARHLHETAHAAGHAGAEVKKLGHEAEAAGEHVGHVEHPHMWESLGMHLRLVHGRFGELNTSIGESREALAEFLPALAALGAGASLVGMFELTNEIAEQRGEFLKTAKVVGILPEQLQELNMAAKLTDVSVETMTGGMTKLNRAVAEAASGKNKDVAGLFAHLHLSLRNADGGLKTVTELLPDLAEAFRKTHDPALRTRAAMALFGRAGAEMLPMLMEGKEGLEEFAKVAKEVDFTPSKEQDEGMEHFHRSWVELTAAGEGFKDMLGAELAPIIQPIVDEMREWLVANREWLSHEISDKVKQLGIWLKTIDWHQVILDMTEFVKGTFALIDSIGGARTVLMAFGLVMASPVVGAVRGVSKAVWELGELILGTLIEAFAAMIPALIAGESAFAAFGAVLAANPIGAAIGAVALLGLAGYALYEHWGTVRKKLGEIWDWLGQPGWPQTAIAIIMPIIPLARTIVSHWEPIKAFFADLWSDVAGSFQWAWDKISPIAGAIGGAASWVGDHLSGASVPHLAFAGGPAGADGGFGTGAAPSAAGGRGGPFDFRPAIAPIPGPYDRDAPASPMQGRVETTITLRNAPPGTTIRSSASGVAAAPKTDVGYGRHGQ